MKPRLSSSSKWTSFPTDFTDKIVEVYNKGFKTQLQTGEFLVDGRIYAEEIMLRIGYLEKGRIKQMNFEVSLDYSQEKHDAMQHLYVGVDAIASMMEEYFQEDGQGVYPILWTPFDFEGELVYMQTSTVNSKLEEEADKILGIAPENLVQEDALSDDAFNNVVIDTELALDVQAELRKKGRAPLN